jgi:glycosyltransferase involved in cell wall biosynthesis
MIRALLVDLAQAFGGAEVRTLTQAKGLQDKTDACAVAVLKDSLLHQRLLAEGLPALPVATGRGNPMIVNDLRRLIKNNRFNVVDAHNVQSILWGMFAARAAGARGIATIHSDFGAEYPGLKGRLYEGVLRITQPFTSYYINVTEGLQQKSERLGNAHKAAFIPNAVQVPAAPLLRRKSGSEWGFADDDFVVGILARLKPVKGHMYLIDAMAELVEYPKAKLLIVGEGELEQLLREQVKRHGLEDRVVFAGFRKDVQHILESIDCLCMSSLSEALPFAILEGASFARPLLVTDVGDLRALLTHMETAYVVPAQSAQALADGIRWHIQNRDASVKLGLNAYNMVKTRFNLETMIDNVLGIYQKVLQ